MGAKSVSWTAAKYRSPPGRPFHWFEAHRRVSHTCERACTGSERGPGHVPSAYEAASGQTLAKVEIPRSQVLTSTRLMSRPLYALTSFQSWELTRLSRTLHSA